MTEQTFGMRRGEVYLLVYRREVYTEALVDEAVTLAAAEGIVLIPLRVHGSPWDVQLLPRQPGEEQS